MTETPASGENGRCFSSGQRVGRVIEIPGSDDWKIECPSCGAWWHGGSTVLAEHDGPRWSSGTPRDVDGRLGP